MNPAGRPATADTSSAGSRGDMDEGYSHWHTDVPISRDYSDEYEEHTAADIERDEELNKIANSDDLGTC